MCNYTFKCLLNPIVGGGTFDTSIVSITALGMYDVRATNGDTRLGGINFTNRLVDFCIEDLKCDCMNIITDQEIMQRLLLACENAKKELSILDETEVVLCIGNDTYKVIITRECFEHLIKDYIEKTMACVDSMLKDARIEKDKIHDIVLVGGSTLMPIVKSTLKDFFGKDVNTSIDPLQSGNLRSLFIESILIN